MHWWMDVGATPFLPPQRGEERVWGSPNLPTAASPLLKGEWMMVMVMMDLQKQHSSVA